MKIVGRLTIYGHYLVAFLKPGKISRTIGNNGIQLRYLHRFKGHHNALLKQVHTNILGQGQGFFCAILVLYLNGLHIAQHNVFIDIAGIEQFLTVYF